MTLLVLAAFAAVLAVGALGWRAGARRRAAVALPPPEDEPRRAPGVGDVVSVAGRDFWTRGEWVLLEDDETVAVLAFDDGDAMLTVSGSTFALRPAEARLDAGATDTLELDRRFFARRRLLPVTICARGEAPLAPAGDALYAEYRAPDGALAVVVGGGPEWHAWLAEPVSQLDLERWGSVPE